MMTTINFLRLAVMAVVAGVFMSACGVKQAASTANSGRGGGGSPFGEVYDAPCSQDAKDTDEYFAAIGIASGSKNRMDVLQTSALTNAQNVIRQKMRHAYQGAIKDYSNAIGNNSGTDMAMHVERAGTQIIDAIVNETNATCGPKFSSVDERGDVTCYTAIRISKKEVASKIADHLSKDEELKIRFDEANFRKGMEEDFKKYKEERQ
jgi:hypothetical protein